MSDGVIAGMMLIIGVIWLVKRFFGDRSIKLMTHTQLLLLPQADMLFNIFRRCIRLDVPLKILQF